MGNQRATRVSKRRGRKSPASDDANDDDMRKIRRERNREAQQVFRKRRQAADVAQKQRIERLESVVENMTLLFIDLFDEVIGNKGVLKQREELLALFQDSATQLKTMVQSVIDSDDDDNASPSPEFTQPINIHESPSCSTSASTSRKCPPSQDSLASERSSPSKGIIGGKFGATPTAFTPAPAYDTGGVETIGLPYVQTTTSNRSSQAFCLQLLEATLSQAYLILADCLPISPDDFHNTFGATLLYRTREEHLGQVRCLLSSDINRKRLAAGMPPREAVRGWQDQNGLQLGLGLAADYEADAVHGKNLPPGFLTALGVQKQLQDLGARRLGSNTLEVSITPTMEDSDVAVLASTLCAPTSKTTDVGLVGGLTFHLNVSLLISNLTNSAKCFLTGPAYSQLDFFKAVEASLISATDV
ncbi:hypothetical protein BDP55DRAFT_716925 [Colletotrichum godetiae]|uniref:BZIP domain-containing protein n=1 Tax=Colletotrichum godetiae TaxID=1209918 RepID=A0AAJ0AIW0_9PEZI|nr:uncharacterized protein BDP55DRAFT_716925 [Colletotrichum godetiae]KAK1674045.1 hypothetical protein BDP55DRAFT_716925 [Colletotrichum godetiae]